MDTTITGTADGTLTITVTHPQAWVREGSTEARQVRAAALNALSALGRQISQAYVTRTAFGPDRTVFTYAPPTVTPADVADLIRRWSALGTYRTADLDHYLTDHLTGKRLDTGTRAFTVTGVMNAGFNGQGIHGYTDDGKPAVHYIR